MNQMVQHREFASLSNGDLPRGRTPLKQSNTHAHPSFYEAENRGAESSVLRHMSERVLSEFIFNCDRNGVDASKLGTQDIRDGFDCTLKGMVNANRDQFATTSFDGFKEFYKQSHNEFVRTGAQAAERHTLSLIDALQVSQTAAFVRPSDRANLEGRIVREALIAGSAYRAAGMTPRHVTAMFRDNTDVAKSPVVGLIERAIDEDVQQKLTRKSNIAREQSKPLNTPAPQPSWSNLSKIK